MTRALESAANANDLADDMRGARRRISSTELVDRRPLVRHPSHEGPRMKRPPSLLDLVRGRSATQ